MKVKIIQEDIDKASKHRLTDNESYCAWSHCPIAQAIKRTRWKHISLWFMPIRTSAMHITVNFASWKLPYEAMNFVARYDNKEVVEPIEFEAHREI